MNRKGVFILFCLILILQSTGQFSSVPSKVSPNAIKLSISTRHDALTYGKMAIAFADSPLGASVGITSASDIQFTSPTTYTGFYKEQTEPFFGKSIAWGGGTTLFENLAADGALSTITDLDLLNLSDTAIPETIAGAAMKEYSDTNELIWIGSSISSYGFTVNNQILEDRGLPKPTTWEDLASPEYYTVGSEFNIGLGNALDTTSITRIYQIILQKYGWEKGWEIIYRITGNGKIYGGAIDTRSSVISGETAIAMTIDFYGVLAMTENPFTEYIIPDNSSVISADPIALSKDPAHPAAANAFIKYVLSPEGQAILLDPTINRLPIRADAFKEPAGLARPDLHALYNQTIETNSITFDEKLALDQYTTTRWHFEFTITDVYAQLRDTWGKMVVAYKDGSFPIQPLERLNKIAEKFGKPAITGSEAILFEPQIPDPAFKLLKQTEWNQFSSDKFIAAEDMIGANYTIPPPDNTTTTSTTTQTISSSITSQTPTTRLTTTITSPTKSDTLISSSSADSSPTTASLNLSIQLILVGIFTSVAIKKKIRR